MGVAERRQRERERRREQIIDAAEQVFFAKGAVNATMDDVAAAAELSKGTLYLYFKSKDELYLAIGLRCLHMIHAQIGATALDDGNPSGLQQLRRLAQAHQRFVEEYPERFQTMVSWLASGFHADTGMPSFDAYQEASVAVFERIIGCIRRGQDDGSIRSDIAPHECAMQLWGGSIGIWLLYFNRHEIAQRLPFAIDFDALVPGFIERLLDTLRAKPAGVAEP